jgi:hexokinase
MISSPDLEEICSQFDVSLESLLAIKKSFKELLLIGLAAKDQILRCLPSFVTKLPSGSEVGKYLVADLGGTNFRIGAVILKGDREYELVERTSVVPDEIKHGSGHDLFAFMANETRSFLQDNPELQTIEELGFTFSFPVNQINLKSGTLIQFNKDYSCNDILGLDVVMLFQSALTAIGVHVKVSSLLNDTIGTLAAHAYKNPATRMSCILGTGSNGAYWEKKENIGKLDDIDGDGMLINIEWGAFGDGGLDVGLPRTQFDGRLLRESNDPSKQTFEKMISGMYLGEIFRLALGTLVQEHVKAYEIETKDIANMIDTTMSRYLKQEALSQFDLVERLAHLIMMRSAKLCGSAIAAIYEHSADDYPDPAIIAIDGSLFTNNLSYQKVLRQTLDDLLGPKLSSRVVIETNAGEPLAGSGIAISSMK